MWFRGCLCTAGCCCFHCLPTALFDFVLWRQKVISGQCKIWVLCSCCVLLKTTLPRIFFFYHKDLLYHKLLFLRVNISICFTYASRLIMSNVNNQGHVWAFPSWTCSDHWWSHKHGFRQTGVKHSPEEWSFSWTLKDALELSFSIRVKELKI